MNWQGLKAREGDDCQVDAVTGDAHVPLEAGSSSQPVVNAQNYPGGGKIALELLEKLQPEKSRHFELVQEPTSRLSTPMGRPVTNFIFNVFQETLPGQQRTHCFGQNAGKCWSTAGLGQVTLQFRRKSWIRQRLKKIFQIIRHGTDLPVARKCRSSLFTGSRTRVIIDALREIIQLDEIYYGPEGVRMGRERA